MIRIETLLLLGLLASFSRADERLYYVAVDTTSQVQVEDALRDMQKRYGIKFGALNSPGTSSSRIGDQAGSNPSGASQAGPLVLKIDHKTRSSGRIPKTEQEFKELTAAAREGPVACYAWIYGKDSPLVQKLQGHTWPELGDDEDVQQCRAEASRVRAARSLLGF